MNSGQTQLTPEMLVPRLGDHLVEKGLITAAQLEEALRQQSELRANSEQAPLLGELLVNLGFISHQTRDQAVTEMIVNLRTALQDANKQLERRVEERTAELQIALKKLEEMSQMKANFISNISHELRTPMTHLKGYLELLLGCDLGPITEDQNTALQTMQRSSNRLEQLIENLILFSVADRGQINLLWKKFPIDTACSRVFEKYVPRAQEKSIRFTSEIPPVSVSVLADEEKITWVVQQFLDNAFKFTNQGGSIHLQVYHQGSIVTILVADSGIGIPQDRINEIFEAFHQLDGSSTRRYGGTGLGLTLAKKIIEAHGSRIQVKSVPGKGSVFSFTLKTVEAT